MKKKLLALLLALTSVCSLAFSACGESGCNTGNSSGSSTVDKIDYAAQVKLDMNSNTKKISAEFRLENHIDGDTTHFIVSDPQFPTGKVKARYLAVNTPESTGKIEEWGKAASRYTKEHLAKATSIILETDGEDWAVDSTGERYLLWVWYKTADMTDYSCLNIELLQEGLAVGSKAGSTRYGEVCINAIAQATTLKLHIFSGQQDPDFYYGSAIELDLRELCTNKNAYLGQRVAFEGIVTQAYNNGIYVEEYDQETGVNFGMYVYYGFNLQSSAVKFLTTPGTRVRIVGEASDQFGFQISGLNYDPYDKKNPDYVQKLETGLAVPCTEISAADYALASKTITWQEESEDETFVQKTFTGSFLELALNTQVSMTGLKVDRVSTTSNGGNNDGAMTLTCSKDGVTISVRTSKLYNSDGTLITAETFQGKTIDVNAIVGLYEEYEQYQLMLYSMDHVTIH